MNLWQCPLTIYYTAAFCFLVLIFALIFIWLLFFTIPKQLDKCHEKLDRTTNSQNHSIPRA